MDLVKITTEFAKLESKFFEGVMLEQGKTYLLPIDIVEWIEDLKLGHRVEGLSEVPLFTREALRYHENPVKVLFTFTGGLGDGISLGILLGAMGKKYNMDFDVACKKEVWTNILKPLGTLGRWIQPPVELGMIGKYDYLELRGDTFLKAKTNLANRCIMEELVSYYQVEASEDSVVYSVPEAVWKSMTLPDTEKIRIGVNFDSKGDVRSYPKSLQSTLIRLVTSVGFEVFVFGCNEPSLPEGLEGDSVYDFTAKTSISELAALVRQMDVMMGVDSFIIHFANLLAVPTIALLSVTRRGTFGWHKHVRCVESRIACSPCDEVFGPCPRGASQCQAFYHPSITPEIITAAVSRECARTLQARIQKQAAMRVRRGSR